MGKATSIKIHKGDITKLKVDCIVNAANNELYGGSGVCGAIFEAAGYDDMTEACKKHGGCKTGKAVITPGFKLPAKHVVHAVGPIYRDGKGGEAKLLKGAYLEALRLAEENGAPLPFHSFLRVFLAILWPKRSRLPLMLLNSTKKNPKTPLAK